MRYCKEPRYAFAVFKSAVSKPSVKRSYNDCRRLRASGSGLDHAAGVQGSLISEQIKGREPKRPFRYFDKGNMAVVGRNFAVLEAGRVRMSGFMTWLVWVFIHVMSLPQLQNRLRVQTQWLWFIVEASKSYADALVHNESEVSTLVSVYALISRMRVTSSSLIVEKQETVVRMIVDTYFSPNKTFPELRDMMNSRAMDPLREFSEACREELRTLKPSW